MSALSTTNPTLADLAKRTDPDGSVADVAEILTETNPILDDMTFIEGNLQTGHRSTIRTGLPTPTWRKLYGGVQPTKSTTAQVTDNCGMLEAYAEVDKALADLNGNTAEFRLTEDRAHIEGMNQEMANSLFYANETTEPEAFTGFGPRFNDQSAENGGNIITSAATPDASDNASMWLVVWSPMTCHGIVPKGSTAGLQVSDKGVVTVEDVDGNGGRMEAYRTHYRWDAGLVVRDWRYVVRIQYDEEDLVKDAATGPDLINLMAKALHRIPNLNMGRPAFYGNRTAIEYLDYQSMSKSTLGLTNIEDAHGKMIQRFRGIPLRRCDALLSNESGI